MVKRSKSSDEAQTASPDAAAKLVDYFAAQLAASRTSRAVDAAQEIMFDAWECDEQRRRVSLARKAIEISPDCADAYVLLAEETAKSPEEAAGLYAQGVAAGERALGPAAFVEDVGMFWGLLETRPYMRARFGLALALWDAGRADEAMGHGEAMLRLNPGDNQGVRYMVLNWLQLLGRDAEADVFLRRYKGDGGAEWTWSAALAAFRRHGDRAAARKALAKAAEANAHVADLLVGRKKPPKTWSPYVTMGGKDEAAAYVEAAAPAWKMTPGALEWVSASLDSAPGPAKRRRPAPRGAV
jgi:tetratricopeptide (TPR) repeat protein